MDILQRKNVNVINQYFMPFAIILIVMAIIFSRPPGWVLYGSLLLLVLALVNNLCAAIVHCVAEPSTV